MSNENSIKDVVGVYGAIAGGIGGAYSLASLNWHGYNLMSTALLNNGNFYGPVNPHDVFSAAHGFNFSDLSAWDEASVITYWALNLFTPFFGGALAGGYLGNKAGRFIGSLFDKR